MRSAVGSEANEARHRGAAKTPGEANEARHRALSAIRHRAHPAIGLSPRPIIVTTSTYEASTIGKTCLEQGSTSA